MRRAQHPPCDELVQLSGRPRAGAAPGEIRLFAKCRNEILRLPAFLHHYRRLGVGRFFVVDNGSSDGTAEYLLEQADVDLFRTEGSFGAANGGTVWLNALLARFGVGFWCLTADIDELIVYPGSERASLRTLVEYLDQAGAQALFCLLLDMYPPGPLNRCRYVAGADPAAAAPCFDPGPYVRTARDVCPGFVVTGGMRERVFYPDARATAPVRRARDALYNRLLSRIPGVSESRLARRWRPVHAPGLAKVPLVKWDENTRYLEVNHHVSPRVVAEEAGALLHFKFFQDFEERAIAEAARGEYFDGASEYRRYARLLAAHPDLSLMCERSVRYEDSEQLVRLGLACDTAGWREWRTR